jgi:prepilin-type N-terminal cleavage/methylation domain-containing protein
MTKTRRRVLSFGGFTLPEVLISIAVLTIIGAIGITAFYGARDSKNLDIITDGIDSVLEQAKADAIAGKNAANFGVHFDTASYAYFSGSTYTAGAATNKVVNLPGGWRLATSSALTSSAIIFTHLTGTAVATGTITISKISNNSTSTTRYITVGSGGDISVIR